MKIEIPPLPEVSSKKSRRMYIYTCVCVCVRAHVDVYMCVYTHRASDTHTKPPVYARESNELPLLPALDANDNK